MDKRPAKEKTGNKSSFDSDTVNVLHSAAALPAGWPPHMNGMARFQQPVHVHNPLVPFPYSRIVNTAASSRPYAAAQNGNTSVAPVFHAAMALQQNGGTRLPPTRTSAPSQNFPPPTQQQPTFRSSVPLSSQGTSHVVPFTNVRPNGTTIPSDRTGAAAQVSFPINGKQKQGPNPNGYRQQQQQQQQKKRKNSAQPATERKRIVRPQNRPFQTSAVILQSVFPPINPTTPDQPPLDRQFISLLNPSDAPLYKEWLVQLPTEVMLLLLCVEAFIVVRPQETSLCPHSQLLRAAWRQRIMMNHAYNDQLSADDSVATGLCCAACLQKQSWGSRQDFVQFADFNHQEEMLQALQKLVVHLRFCPLARKRHPLLRQGTFDIHNDTDWLALRAFTEWCCEYMCAGEAIARERPVPVPSQSIRQRAFGAVARYKALEETSGRAFEDMDHALSEVPHTKNRTKGLLAADLTEVSSDDALSDFPFYFLVQEHVEIARLTTENAQQHAATAKLNGTDSVVVFQCRCCHGTCCVNSTDSKERPYVPFNGSDQKAFICDFIKLVYHHLQACPRVSSRSKERMKRVMPTVNSIEFHRFIETLWTHQIKEWDKHIKAGLDCLNMAANTPPCEAVPLWRPLNDLVEGSGSMWSTIPPTPATIPFPASITDNDVLEGFDGANEHVGNRRFRTLVAEKRTAFLSTTSEKQKENIVKEVWKRIRSKKGFFRRWDASRGWTLLSGSEVADRVRTALQKGFAHLLLPYSSRRGHGVGANVLECEVAPMYDVLSGRKRGPVKVPTGPSGNGGVLSTEPSGNGGVLMTGPSGNGSAFLPHAPVEFYGTSGDKSLGGPASGSMIPASNKRPRLGAQPSATINASESKYSYAKVRERIAPDGSVMPVSEPKKGRNGMYVRPPGRGRHGMDWDEVRGCWVTMRKTTVDL